MDTSEETTPRSQIPIPASTTTMPYNDGSESRPAPVPSDWSLWLLPLVALMLVAGPVAIYFLPTNLDLLWPLCFGLLLATALLCLIALRMIPKITSPSNNVVRHRAGGKVTGWNPFVSFSTLLLVGILTTALATIGLFGFALSNAEYYVVNAEIGRPFVLLATATITVFLLLLVWLMRIGPLQKLFQLHFAGVGVLIIPAFAYLTLNSGLPPMLYTPAVYTGSFASWPEMVQFARHEADRIDNDAVVYQIDIFPSSFDEGPYGPQTTNFNVGFMFARPTGEGFEIELLDTNPIRLEHMFKQSSALIYYSYAHERSADWLAYLKLSPREVYTLTEKEARAFAQRNGSNFAEFWPSVTAIVDLNSVMWTEFGKADVWDMHYISNSINQSIDLIIDGTTGRELARLSLPDESTPTPTPHPSATATPTP